MCGICAFIYRNASGVSECERKVLQDTLSLDRRGPDHHSHQQCSVTDDVNALFYGTLLHFRGCFTPQPLQSSTGNILLWNGEIFGGIEVGEEENDGLKLLELLDKSELDADVLTHISAIEGPWALIYWQRNRRKLWFGRDVFGRRSLLVHVLGDGEGLGLSSVQLKQFESWREIPASGVFCLTMEGATSGSNDILPCGNLVLHPWVHAEALRSSRIISTKESKLFNEVLTFEAFVGLKNVEMKISDFGVQCHLPILNFSLSGNSAEADDVLKEEGDSRHELLRWATAEQLRLAEALRKVLGDAVRVRVKCQSQYCNECMRVRLERTKESSWKNEKRDSGSCALFQVDAGVCTDKRETITGGYSSPPIERAFCSNGVSSNEKSFNVGDDNHETDGDPGDSSVIGRVDNSHRITRNEPSHDRNCRQCGYICQKVPDKVGKCTSVDMAKLCPSVSAADVAGPGSVKCRHAKVAILFSGGVDSLVIAALADKFVASDEPIDLLNVAFEQQSNRAKSSSSGAYDVPDRITGRQGLTELKTVAPNRQWNFVEIDVSIEELQKTRAEHIQDLVYPLNTVLDDSIGCAVWFAARGRGTLDADTTNRIPYISPARVVLVGMGADEQFAGYSRHRIRFKESGWDGLNEEIQMEIRRISSRNLGRDDRVISDHSREARIPFLDEAVVNFTSSLPIYMKVNLSLPRGVGEKFLLRLCALQLGLTKGSLLQKRAIQFGSRIAKAENHRERASDVCVRLQQAATPEQGLI